MPVDRVTGLRFLVAVEDATLRRDRHRTGRTPSTVPRYPVANGDVDPPSGAKGASMLVRICTGCALSLTIVTAALAQAIQPSPSL
jgi:hypothetical protein